MSKSFSEPPINGSRTFKWNNYQDHLSTVVRGLLEEESMVDVTLSVAGERIHAHRIVLCACSTFFQQIFSETNQEHATIIISDVEPRDIRSIIEYSYQGEVRVPAENISGLLGAAHLLKIFGLMEIDGLDENDASTAKDSDEEIDENVVECTEQEELEVINVIKRKRKMCESSELSEEEVSDQKRKKKKRDHVKKEYSEEMLDAAINDLRNGKTLNEAASSNHIPRSTLYMKAKTLGIQLNAARNEYPAECMKAAIDTVLNGSSLQHAAEMYGIPKTVLWRRIQKEGYQIIRSEMKRAYGSEKREAAVKALQRGEPLTKVALEFKIPKTTLFRDKARLVDQGKLPSSFWKKRKTENEGLKKTRLEEAMAACRSGKMSQAAAAVAFSIPKTTIWRRLQQENKKKSEDANSSKNEVREDDEEEVEQDVHDGVTFCEVASEIPITYIDENSIPQDSVIILTTDDVDSLNLEDNRPIIVNADSGQEYIPCAISIKGNTNYTSSET